MLPSAQLLALYPPDLQPSSLEHLRTHFPGANTQEEGQVAASQGQTPTLLEARLEDKLCAQGCRLFYHEGPAPHCPPTSRPSLGPS